VRRPQCSMAGGMLTVNTSVAGTMALTLRHEGGR
jgi:hypothetical protein